MVKFSDFEIHSHVCFLLVAIFPSKCITSIRMKHRPTWGTRLLCSASQSILFTNISYVIEELPLVLFLSTTSCPARIAVHEFVCSPSINVFMPPSPFPPRREKLCLEIIYLRSYVKFNSRFFFPCYYSFPTHYLYFLASLVDVFQGLQSHVLRLP